ncbi:unnamed protein product [Meganyctiphanes norvegica]|uniref:CENP-V/GFA domain-containing protein n=1 Tax=Meganyctiphanes norvegica TaxID=48144 RepID=A0AAV2QBH2_MEGNR
MGNISNSQPRIIKYPNGKPIKTQVLWKMSDHDLIKHTGGCHCGAVRFEVQALPIINVIECNCSYCHKKQNLHFIVPAQHFKLIKGHQAISTYSFNTNKAKHDFCSSCGVQSFFIPRANIDGYGIVPHCLDEGTVRKMKIEKFDGKHWEEAVKKNKHIMQLPKVTNHNAH